MKLLKKLYEYIGRDIDQVQDDLNRGYLTENEGRDGRTYYWYLDETECIAICCDNGIIYDEEDFFSEQFL